MVGWHHRLKEHELEQAPGVGDGQGISLCCSSWGCKELDMTEQLNWTGLNYGGSDGIQGQLHRTGCKWITLLNF